MLTNADDGNPLEFAEKAFQWVAPAILQAPGCERYAGRYRSPWGDVQVLVIEGRLAMVDPSLPDPMLTVTGLTPVSGSTFRSVTKNGFGSNGEPVVFEPGDDGQVRRLKVGDNFLDPVAVW